MGWLAQKLGAGGTPLGGKSVYQSKGVPFLRSQKGSRPMVVSATVRILVRNLESDTARLQFSNFFVKELRQGDLLQLEAVRKFFPDATYGEWIFERDYASIPPVPEDWSGFGAIPYEIEDLLLLLRLYRPGDLTFAGVHVETPNSSAKQYPYRAISGLVGESTRQFIFSQADCKTWEHFEAPLRLSSQWSSSWFAVSRRFFLYGGGKEFKPFVGEVDRVMDYMIALEAAIVPEFEFVSRRLRERAVRLLPLHGDEESDAKKLINQMYQIRSTLAHGSPLNSEQISLLRDRQQWWRFEEVVREILTSALTKVPSDDSSRRAYLKDLYDISDAGRAEKIQQDFNALTNVDIKRKLLNILAKKRNVRGMTCPLWAKEIWRLLCKWTWRLKRILRPRA